MALVPIRNIGQFGVNTDIDPLDLPLNMFTAGSNVRFADNKISRGPVFASIGTSTNNATPRWAFGYRLQDQSSRYLVMNQNGTVASLQAATPGSALTYTDLSVAAYTPSVQSLPFTATLLSNVVYTNRSDRVPWSMIPSAASFVTLTGWDPTWRAGALRSFNGCLVALNITKGAVAYPQMIKTSDFAPFSTVPATWTAAPTNSATENVLSDLSEAIVDGWTLRDKFMIYSNHETWQMVPTEDTFIYSYQKLFSDYGVINVNCVADVNNQHFVFGYNDIWAHDGFTPKSVANGRVRKFIFDNIVRAETYQFFVWSNPKLNEVMFCYVSDDPYCAFPAQQNGTYPGCNRAAVYNWMYDTWYFYDLPYINGGGLGEMYSGLTYDDVNGLNYESVSGTYQGLYDSSRLFSIAVGRGGSVLFAALPNQTTGTWATDRTHLYSFETLENVVGVATIVDVVNAPSFVENVQMDMDEIAQEIRGYKIVTAIYPEGRLEHTENPMTFWYGSADYSGQTASYGLPMTFDGQSLYKLDFNSPGRFLSMRMCVANPPQKFTWSGMDIDVKGFGHR